MFETLTDVLAEVELSYASKALHLANEAETRLKVIDRILFEGLAWRREDAIVEQPVRQLSSSSHTLFLDYLLTHQGETYLVVEAKRAGQTFEFPADLSRFDYTLKTLVEHCGDALRDVINQAHSYAIQEGAPYSAVTNGFQWLVFRTFTAGLGLLKTKALIFRGLQEIAKDASRFHRAFAPGAFHSGEIDSILSLPRAPAPRFVGMYNDLRGSDPGVGENPLARSFGTVFPLFFDSLIGSGDEQALRECYVDVPPHKNYEREFAALLQRSLPHYLSRDTPLCKSGCAAFCRTRRADHRGQALCDNFGGQCRRRKINLHPSSLTRVLARLVIVALVHRGLYQRS